MTRAAPFDGGAESAGFRYGPAEKAGNLAALPRLVEAPSGAEVACGQPKMTVAVTSGKGGVGKTNLAVNLGVCLQERGLKATLVDLDMGLANADVLLGVQPRHTLADVVSGRRALAEVVVAAANGLSFIAGASGTGAVCDLSDIGRARLADRLMTLAGDVVLLDCSAGIAPSVTTYARAADVVLVVTTPEPTALTDAYATVKTLLREGYGGSLRLVVNMVESRPEAKGAYERCRGVCEKFMKYPIADAGYMLHDTHVELAVRQREPFVLRYPKSAASICVSAISARLVNGAATRRNERGLLSRVAGMFM